MMSNESSNTAPQQELITTTGYVPAQPVSNDPLVMIGEAIRAGLDPTGLRALLDMRKELKEEAARESFLAALSGFQAEMPRIAKTKAVKDKQGRVRYSYAPLDSIIEQVKPMLSKYGFSYTMKSVQETGGEFTAVVEIHHRDGHQEQSQFTVPIDPEAYMNAPQKVGSARTFAMRYAFTNAFGILTGDQDDDAGSFDADQVMSYQPRLDEIRKAQTLDELKEVFLRNYKALGSDKAGQKLISAAKDERKKELANA
jgi:hypothetical protein